MAAGTKKKASWAQPSLSRDFALLSAAILFIMLLISAWVAWITYIKHTERIEAELAKEANRIERMLESEIESTRHLLTALGRHIALKEKRELRELAHMLQAFSTGNKKYAVWSWSGPTEHVIVSSNLGILENPVNVSDRDYVALSRATPWSLFIGKPIEGRVSDKWVIPIAMGITDSTGKYIGSLNASVDINVLTEQISHIVRRNGISFAVISRNFIPLTIVSDSEEFVVESLPLQRLRELDLQKQPRGLMTRARPFQHSGIYSFYEVSEPYPYIIVVGYDSMASDSAIRSLLWPRMIQIAVVAGFLLSFLWIIRSRVIKPVVELSDISASVAAGNGYRSMSKAGPQEIEHLSSQIRMIDKFIHERRMLEDELRDKIRQLQRQHARTQSEIRQRATLLAGLLSEYKKSLHHINALAQTLKDQHYGPLENTKYLQCSGDIHQTGTTLELMVRKLIALSRVDAAAVVMREEPVFLPAVLEQAWRFVMESLAETGARQPSVSDPSALPEATVQADRLLLQQALAYVFFYLAAQMQEGEDMLIRLQTFSVSAGKGEEALGMAIGIGDFAKIDESQLEIAAWKENTEPHLFGAEDALREQLHLSLSYSLLKAMNIGIRTIRGHETGIWCLLLFPAGPAHRSRQ